MKKYHCFFNEKENEQHTIEARSLKELREIITEKFDIKPKARWYKNKIPEGYPFGALRYIIRVYHKYPKTKYNPGIKYKVYLLIIPD